MRKFVLITSIFLSVLVMSFWQHNEVQALTYPTDCYPILGVTQTIGKALEDDPASSVANAGALFFDAGISLPGIGPSVPNPDVRACAVDLGPQGAPTDVRYILDGWVVDSNLGWVNFNCKNGKGRGGTNCSDLGIDYRVEVLQNGQMQGFAYSDVAGWVSMRCVGGINTMEGFDYACGAVSYGVLVDMTPASGTLPPDTVYSPNLYQPIVNFALFQHAWTDRLGWMNMLGMRLPVGETLAGFGDDAYGNWQCSDKIDNDSDAKIDFRGVSPDPGCFDLTDDDERNSQCSDNIDNDRDGKIDFDGFGRRGPDPGCLSFDDNNEIDPVILPECSDGVDNDGDGYTDFPEPGCFSDFDNSETDTECSDWLDNDGDGKADYAGYGAMTADPQCEGNPNDDDESGIFVGQCADGIDNNGDGKADFFGVDRSVPPNGTTDDPEDLAPDPACFNEGDISEGSVTQCSDGLDNDADLLVDFGQDPGCISYADDNETNGVGPEVPTEGGDLTEGEGFFDTGGTPECSDGQDNDRDGKIDFGEDLGCYSADDDNEIDTECSDGIDNDLDGTIDYLGGSGGELRDPHCSSFEDNSEDAPVCDDGFDNDGDGTMDFAGMDRSSPPDGDALDPEDIKKDPNCADDPNGESEHGVECTEDPGLLNLADPLTFQHCFDFPQQGNWLSIYPDPYTNPVIADGKRGYNILLHLADIDGTPYDDSGTYTFNPSITLDNIVDADWKAERFKDDGSLPGFGITDLDPSYITDFNFIRVVEEIPVNTWIAHVQSPVPTTGGPEVFYVVPKSLAGNVPEPDGETTPVPKNSFIVPKLTMRVLEGVSERLNIDLVARENPVGVDDADLRYDPIALITSILADGKSFIDGVRDVQNYVELEVEYRGVKTGPVATQTSVDPDDISIDFILSPYDIFYDVSSEGPMSFLYDLVSYPAFGTATEPSDPTLADDPTYAANFNDLIGQVNQFVIKPFLAVDEEDLEYVGKPSWVSYVSYFLPGFGNVSYYVDSLPATEVQGVFNPSIDVIGLIYSRVITNPRDQDKYFSTGNLTSNLLRDTVTTNISNILGNQVVADASGNMVVSYLGPRNKCHVALPTGAIALDLGGSIMYYIDDGDIIFQAGANDIDCSGKNAAFVAVDGNVFIDNNILGGVGVVALRKGVGIETFKYGHAYLAPKVTDNYVNFVLDGTFWSYDGTKDAFAFESSGRPKNALSVDDLKFQYVNWGSFTSNNTAGGSVEGAHADKGVPEGTYINCDGRYTKDQDLARICDLNYLRTFRLFLERVTSADGKLTIVVDQQCKQDEDISAMEQLDHIRSGKKDSCYSIDEEKSFENGGDLIDKDPDGGGSLRSKSLQEHPVDSPFVVRFKTSTHPIFRLRKGTEFGRPNF